MKSTSDLINSRLRQKGKELFLNLSDVILLNGKAGGTKIAEEIIQNTIAVRISLVLDVGL